MKFSALISFLVWALAIEMPGPYALGNLEREKTTCSWDRPLSEAGSLMLLAPNAAHLLFIG